MSPRRLGLALGSAVSGGLALLLLVVPLAGAAVPVLTLPGTITQYTAGASAVVNFTATADDGGVSVPVVCNPDSGSSFALGTTVVSCSADNGVDSPATGSFSVRIVGPPSLSLPANQTVDVDGVTSTAVSFSASASDLLGALSVNCAPGSGSSFPLGTTTVNCSATNPAGTSSGSFQVTVRDLTPPPAPTISGPTGTIADKTPTFTFTSSGATSFLCAIDDSTPTAACSSPFTSSALGDGAHTFYAIARDGAGNTSGVASSGPFTVDATPPPVPTLGGPTGTIADKTPTFTFTSTGATSFLCAIDDTTPTTACTSPFTPAALADGAHTFSAIARDALLNASAAATSSFTVDTTPPPVPTLGGPTGTIADKTPTFTFTSSGATSFLCAIDDTTPTTVCTSPFTPAALADGAHTFYAIARDALLNASAAAGRTVTVDTTPPVLTGPGNLTVQANGPAGSQVNFTVSGSDAGAALLPSAITCTPASGSTFKVQNTTVTCTATDSAGNVGTVAFNIRVADSTPPSINAPDVSVTATSAAGIRRTDPALAAYLSAISATDLISSVKLTTNVPETLPIGVTTIIVTAVDTSGNTAQKSVKITVLPPGKVAPPADFTPPGPVKNAAAKAGDRSIVLTWEPPSVPDLAYVEVRRSIVGQSGKGTLVYKGLKRTLTNTGLRNDVAYRYVLVAYDKVGNSSRSVVVTATPATQLLAAPKAAARVTTPPLLQWAHVAAASYFNVQLYRGSLKVLSAWPQVTRLQLGKRWVYEKKAFTLEPGTYTWYVWPGIGARSATRYGPLLGKSTFVVMKAKPVKKKAKPVKKSTL